MVPESEAPQGILQTWIEIMDPKTAKARKPVDVRPPPREEFELRLIVWETKDVVF